MNEHEPASTARIEIDRRQFLQYMGAGVAALGMASSLYSPFVGAQDMSNGANNFYTSDLVTMQKVAFPSLYRLNVAGNLFLPIHADASSRLPAIVVGHPMGAVKEQSANLYATKMAEQGFATLAIDLPFWGKVKGRHAKLCRRMYTQKHLALPLIISAHTLLLIVSELERLGCVAAVVS
ncbi:alpha/beta hydrolase [Halomonas sp. LY9]